MYICDVCRETGQDDCIRCSMGNPCLGCSDYDEEKDECRSDGACGEGEKMTDRENMYVVTDIDWETDGEHVDLPVDCDIAAPDEDEAVNRLSDKYGWLIRGVGNVQILEETGEPENRSRT